MRKHPNAKYRLPLHSRRPTAALIFAAVLGWYCSVVSGATTDKHYSRYTGKAYPQQVYWGDTHIHSSLSADAYIRGNRLSLADSLRFARGDAVVSTTGQTIKLREPLDFAVVSDHAEFLGVINLLSAQDPDFMNTALGKHWHTLQQEHGLQAVMKEFMAVMSGQRALNYADSTKHSVWASITQTVERFNNAGVFTAFHGYEWSATPNGNNLHRNVIFRDDANRVSQVLPVSALDSPDPAALWQALQSYEQATGGRALAIPHNGNASNGLMYDDKDRNGQPLSPEYAHTRARWEPLMEVTQIKGDGETHPYLSPDDEFANYESWHQTNLTRQTAKAPWMLQYEYGRSALKLGLRLDQQLGSNPFKYGFIGSSDTHTGLAGVAENNFTGKFSLDEPRKDRASWGIASQSSQQIPPYVAKNHAAAGYAAVWATENTRAALFDAMQRKETYATTGPRMVVRFFGGWTFAPNDDLRPDYDRIGYQQGVPMGGDLYNGKTGQAPQFMVIASKDPQGANLERIQIIKGWLRADGSTAEKVYNVAVSDQRRIRSNKVKPLESTVDLKSATYTNSIGAVQLSTVWTDPEFNPSQRAFYYARVLEIPTPRWTTYDAAFYDTPLPSDVPAQHQERAYTSPIWYTPAATRQ